jgi:hypothetical protein
MSTQTRTDSDDFDYSGWADFERHFPKRSNDLTLVVLKGHLLLEQGINRLLTALLRFPEEIERANLHFYQKLCLIRALNPIQLSVGAADLLRAAGGDPKAVGATDLLDVVEKLNTLRNRLAHHLDHPEIELRVKEILSLCKIPQCMPLFKEPNNPETEADPLIRDLKQTIAWVCCFVQALSGAPRR